MDWGAVLAKAREAAEGYLKQNGFPLTLRGLFYILVTLGVLPNTASAYKGLSRVTAEARYEGEFPPGLIRDVTRAVEQLEPEESHPEGPLDKETLRKTVLGVLDGFFSVRVNPWADQPKRVVVLIEKEAQFSLVTKLIKEDFEHGVLQAVFSRGYDSATDMIRLAGAISGINREGKKAVLLIITDFDPSGEDIARDYSSRLRKIDPSLDFEAKKIAVTKRQIEEFNLPATPESLEEIAKLRRDPRYSRFVTEHGLVRVELDALVALRPDDFRRVLRGEIRRHFDRRIYEKVTRPKEERLRELAQRYRAETLENLRGVSW
jgi:5S rRNA maturation endonuclease (ribonuclease M5)